MSYLQRNEKNNKRGRFMRNAIFLVLILVLLSLIFPNFGSSLTRKAFYPLWAIKMKVLQGNSIETVLKSKNALIAENRRLEDLVVRGKLQMMTIEEMREENRDLREILNNLDTREAVNADILARPPISAYDTFVISAGRLSALETGQEVLAYGEVPVGEVAEVEERSALVRLYSAPGNSFQATLSKNSEPIELRGKGAGNFEAKVPKSIEVEKGDKILFGGTTKILGVVEEIESKEVDSFKTLYVKSPINIFKLKMVQVLL
jgi:cell shape-determining protein MreC